MGLPFEVAEAILKEEAEKRLEDFKTPTPGDHYLSEYIGQVRKEPH